MVDFYVGDELAHFIATSLGGSWAVGTNIFVGHLEGEPDDQLAVIERGGGPPFMTLEQSSGSSASQMKVDQPTVQIRARAASYATGQQTVNAVFKALHAVSEQTLNSGGLLFHLIEAVQSPIYLGRDENQRHEWSQNFRLLVENTNR